MHIFWKSRYFHKSGTIKKLLELSKVLDLKSVIVFIGAGRRHKTPGPKTKDSLLPIAITEQNIGIFHVGSWAPFPPGQYEQSQMVPAQAVGCITVKEPWT